VSVFVYCSRCGHTRAAHSYGGRCHALEAGQCECIGWTTRIEHEAGIRADGKVCHRRVYLYARHEAEGA
jgi:hypothetical protein